MIRLEIEICNQDGVLISPTPHKRLSIKSNILLFLSKFSPSIFKGVSVSTVYDESPHLIRANLFFFASWLLCQMTQDVSNVRENSL